MKFFHLIEVLQQLEWEAVGTSLLVAPVKDASA